MVWTPNGNEVKVEKPAISQQVLDKTFRDKVIGHSRGLITEAQRKWSERQTCTVGQIPLNRSYLVSCQKGSKRTPNYEPPNQDNWSVTAFKSGWTLFCVHDGHGPYGHFVSTRTVQTVPWYLMESGFDKTCIESIDVLSKPLSITMETAYSRHCYLHCYGPPTLATADAWLVQKKARSFLQQRTTKFVVFRGEKDLAFLQRMFS